MSDPMTQVINLIRDQLHVHDEVFHNIEDWSKELTAVLNQHHNDTANAFHAIAELIENYERRINRLEDRVGELERR